jgi:hypothetical protein
VGPFLAASERAQPKVAAVIIAALRAYRSYVSLTGDTQLATAVFFYPASLAWSLVHGLPPLHFGVGLGVVKPWRVLVDPFAARLNKRVGRAREDGEKRERCSLKAQADHGDTDQSANLPIHR